MRQHSIPFAALALAATAACTEPDATLGTTTASLCGDWGCGGNSSTMGPYRSHEFNLVGLPNEEGLRVDGFFLGGVRFTPRIQGDHFYAKHSILGERHGGQLVNGYLRIFDKDNHEFRMHFAAVSNAVTFWLGDPDAVQTYELLYSEGNAGKKTPLCNNPPPPTDASGLVWTRAFESVLFTGDRINRHKQIWSTAAAATTDWMTIGCAGSALAKMHLSRHTTAGSKGSFTASPAERQAMLNMFTANICGDGISHTEPNTPLRWKNADGWYSEFAPAWELEAIWGPSGAVCFDDTYRLPGVDPLALCGAHARPSCADLPGYDEASWQAWGTVRSAVP
jgi:hypothetical protein